MSTLPLDTDISPSAAKELDNPAPSPPTPSDSLPTLSDLFKEMKVDEIQTTSVGPRVTIDVIPDFRPIIYQLAYHSTKIYTQIAQYNCPYITPASILAYSLHSIYSYGTMCDIWHVRESTSFYGHTVLNEAVFPQYMTLSLHSAVPVFVQRIIQGLVHTIDPRRKNMAYIYSFASFDYQHDFGRVYPIHMFTILHDLIANAAKNATADDIWREWMNTPVLTTPTGALRVGNIIGGAYGAHLVDNYMTRALKQLLSPLTRENRSRRPVFTPFEYGTFTSFNFEDVNPYYYIFGTHLPNISHGMFFLNTMRPIFMDIDKKSLPLGKMFELASGSQLMNHYYSEPTTPTFHNLSIKVTDTSTYKTESAFAETIKFSCTWKCPETRRHVFAQPAAEDMFTPELCLVDFTKTEATSSVTTVTRQRSETPGDILIYLPWSTGKSSAYYPVTTGLVIESAEIDGFQTPQPVTSNSITDENSHFLDSAIPIQQTIGLTDLGATRPLPIRQRASDELRTHRIGHCLYDRATHRLPLYPTIIASAQGTPLLPGFTQDDMFINPDYAPTKVAYQASDRLDKKKKDSLFPLKFYAWSSYRWIDPKYAMTNTHRQHIYSIMNFRTMYGTFPETIKSKLVEDITQLV